MNETFKTPGKEQSDLKRKSPGEGSEFSPQQTDNSKQPRNMSPIHVLDKQPPEAQAAHTPPGAQGRPGYLKAVRANNNWKDIGPEACLLRHNVSKQLSTYNREPKEYSIKEIENKAKVEFSKMEWMISRELHQTLLDHIKNTKKNWTENSDKKTHHADNLTKWLKVL